MNTNEFLQAYRRVEFGMNVTRPRVRCADGYTVSIQAGRGLYSSPRVDADSYTHVELGYPNKEDPELFDYAECRDEPKGTVYAAVPVELVDRVLQKHGGIVGADFSNDQAGKWRGYDG